MNYESPKISLTKLKFLRSDFIFIFENSNATPGRISKETAKVRETLKPTKDKVTTKPKKPALDCVKNQESGIWRVGPGRRKVTKNQKSPLALTGSFDVRSKDIGLD